MKQSYRYFEKLLEEDLETIVEVGARFKEGRRVVDGVEYKALKSAFMIRVTEGASEHIRMILTDLDYNIGAWQKMQMIHPEGSAISNAYLNKIETLNRAKEVILTSEVEQRLTNCLSIADAREALSLALNTCIQVGSILNLDAPV